MSRTMSFCLVAAGLLAACREDPGSLVRPPAETTPTPELNPAIVASAPQRVKWRFKLDSDYALHSPGVGADGTVYVSSTRGKLYAIAPDGTQRWVFLAGPGGAVSEPVSVGADGTIYTAGAVSASAGSGSTGAVFAITPSGTKKWVFSATNQFLIAGPNVGPDGNIYAVAELPGIGLFSLTPAGQLRFRTGSFSEYGSLGEEIAFGSGQLYFAFDMVGTGNPASLFGYDFNGGKRFQVSGAANNSRPAVGPNGNIVIQAFPSNIGLSLTAYSPTGSKLWSFYEFPGNTEENPDVGPDNVAYTVRNLSTLVALGAGGTLRWRHVDANILFQPRVRPQNDLLFMGGRITYGQPGLFQAVSTTGTPLWRVDLPDEPGFAPYGQLVPMTRPVFSPDGNTAYAVTDVAGDGAVLNPYSFLYAIDLRPGSVGNTVPVATLVAKTSTTIPVGGSVTVQASFTDPDQGPWSYTFRWGNGPTSGTISTAGSITKSRTYTVAGSYRIRFIVTDALGATDTSNVVRVQVR